MEAQPISDALAQKLALAFDLSATEVIADAQRVAAWNEPFDDLLVWLEQRHQWDAERAARYLLSVRTALAGELDNS